MKAFCLISVFFLVIFSAKAQSDNEAHYGNKTYRAVMGGGQKVKYDTITPLTDLIKKLEKPWDFIETYKGYWIGYTDDMYSIARYKDKAVEPLINFIDTSPNLKARKGALFTLHLIGINFRIVGRFSEDFENKTAREALLKYLNNSDLNEIAVFLLMRDPWLSDIPKLIDYLSEPGRDYSRVLSALQRYNFKGKPFEQELKDTILKKNIDVNASGSGRRQTMCALIAFQKELAPYFLVDEEITESEEWKKSLNELAVNKASKNMLSFYDFVQVNADFSYCKFNEPIDYTFLDHKVEIYGPVKVRQIWLDWWKVLSKSEKDRLFLSDHVPFDAKR